MYLQVIDSEVIQFGPEAVDTISTLLVLGSSFTLGGQINSFLH